MMQQRFGKGDNETRWLDPFDAALEELKGMSSLQLVAHAEATYSMKLNPENAWEWLYKKVAYAVQESIKGPLEGRAAERARELDSPAIIKQYNEEAIGGSNMADATNKAAKVVKVKTQEDEHGFKVGTKFSKGFAMLLKGCEGKAMEEAVGKSTAGGMKGNLRCDPKDCSSGRAAVIQKTRLENGDYHYQITQYTDKNGKTHKVAFVAPKNIAVEKVPEPKAPKEKVAKAPKEKVAKAPKVAPAKK